jgi:prepilin-type N-terminal cleavage/methylation domain-containing protein
MSRAPRAFTLVEILVVIAIIMVLMSLLIPVGALVWKKARYNAAISSAQVMSIAIESYYNDFGEYPPDNTPSADGNESLTYHLTTLFEIGDRHLGPYMTSPQRQTRDADGDGLYEFYSPIGGKYEYRQLHGPGGRAIYMFVDPGHDLNLGGGINPASGFVPDGSGADKDNIERSGQH